MIRLTVTSGKQAGRSVVATRFPVTLGREAASALPLDDPGVWDSHATIVVAAGEGFVLRCRPGTTADVGGKAVAERRLRAGDIVGLGGCKIRFGLSETRPRGFRGREWATWAGVAALCAVQLALIYFVLP